jgi:hypothetical protein
MQSDEIFTEVAAAHGAKALQISVGDIHFDVSLHAILAYHPKNGRMKRKRMQFETKNARNQMLATWRNELSAAAQIAHMSEHVCFPHGSAQRISTGNSSLQMAQVNGGASILNTPARAVSTAATAARPALAKRCSAEAVTPAPAVAAVALAIVTVLESLTDL